ncbi:hypothetical protein NPIL_286041, partial [Nephila pilipes]
GHLMTIKPCADRTLNRGVPHGEINVFFPIRATL